MVEPFKILRIRFYEALNWIDHKTKWNNMSMTQSFDPLKFCFGEISNLNTLMSLTLAG